MTFRSPFEWLPDQLQAATLVLLVIIGIGMAILWKYAVPSHVSMNDEKYAPLGIMISFELAGTFEKSQAIIDDGWNTTEKKIIAGTSLGADYWLIVWYTLFLGLGTVIVARNLAEHYALLSTIGILLAWGVLLAGVLDSIENVALMRLLLGAQETWLSSVAWWCATLKFLLLGVAGVYTVVGFIIAKLT